MASPPAAGAAPAGRAQARRRVAADGRGLRGRLAVPILAVGVVGLTWMDAGVLRAEDAQPRTNTIDPGARSAANYEGLRRLARPAPDETELRARVAADRDDARPQDPGEPEEED